MDPHQTAAPVRGALFYTVQLLLLATVGTSLQQSLGVTGIVLSRVLLFLGVTLLWIRSLERQPAAAVLRAHLPSWSTAASSALVGVVAALLAQGAGMLTTLLIQALGGTLPPLYEGLTESPFMLALFTWALLPAICEEVAYRGYLQWSLHPLGARLAVFLTAVLFGAMHHSLVRLVPLALLGFVFGVAVQRTGSLVPAIIMHFINNAMALTFTYYLHVPTPTATAVLWLAPGTLVLGGATWLLIRRLGPAPSTNLEVSREDARAVRAGVIGCLLPAILMYVYSSYLELSRTFGS